MITGMVNANREATIRFMVIGPQGHQQEIEAIIDTGFTGSLTLSPLLVATLGLAWLCRSIMHCGSTSSTAVLSLLQHSLDPERSASRRTKAYFSTQSTL